MNIVEVSSMNTFLMSSIIKTLREVFTTVEMFPTFDPYTPYSQHRGIGNVEVFAYNFPSVSLDRQKLQSFPFHPKAAYARYTIRDENFPFLRRHREWSCPTNTTGRYSWTPGERRGEETGTCWFRDWDASLKIHEHFRDVSISRMTFIKRGQPAKAFDIFFEKARG